MLGMQESIRYVYVHNGWKNRKSTSLVLLNLGGQSFTTLSSLISKHDRLFFSRKNNPPYSLLFEGILQASSTKFCLLVYNFEEKIPTYSFISAYSFIRELRVCPHTSCAFVCSSRSILILTDLYALHTNHPFQVAFWISALVYCPGFVIFQLWGTDELQDWN